MDCQVLEWINLRDKKISLTEIAKMYGTSRESVRRKLLSVGGIMLIKDVKLRPFISEVTKGSQSCLILCTMAFRKT